jgi:hypothetical protein
MMNIPERAHFVWLGSSFPWVNVLAVRSAALRGGFSEVVLHHDSDLSGTEHYRELVETPGVRLRSLNFEETFSRCGSHAAGLHDLLRRLRTPQTRSDLARFAILYGEGGVYLDTDTVTVRDFHPLLSGASAFLGLERIVYTSDVMDSERAHIRIAAHGRALVRDLLRRLPEGWRLFRRLERFYSLAANPAILAAASGSPFLERALEEMLRIPKERQPEPYVIGPHLVQHLLKVYAAPDLAVYGPAFFYPLAPEISEHWFRIRKGPKLDRVLSEQTRVVHWYASVRTRSIVPKISPAYVRKHADRQLFSALALPFV